VAGFWGSDRDFAAQHPQGAPKAWRIRALTPKTPDPELVFDRTSALSAMFRCRSVAAAGDLHFFVSPKKPKEKKGDPGACVPSLRCGQPAVLGPAGVSCKLASLKQARALIRLTLCSSAHSQGVGCEFGFGRAFNPRCGLNACYIFYSCLRRYSLGLRPKSL
jgi:hypothetical protein